VAVYDSYGSTGGANWYVFGGTSVASPIIASFYALANAAANSSSSPGPSGLYSHSGSLNDVTSGNNGRCTTRRNTTTTWLCTAGQGFDGPTGLGTPNGAGAF
jgi:subtilase family serine protease